MGFQRSERGNVFNHYNLISDDGKASVLIGVGQDLDESQISMLYDSPLISYCSDIFWNKYMLLNGINRTIISKTLDRLPVNKKKVHIGENWRAISSYICQLNNIGLMDAIPKSVDKFRYYDIDYLRECCSILTKAYKTAAPRKELMGYLRRFCIVYLISPEILETGKGKVYSVSPDIYKDKEKMIEIEKQYCWENIKSLFPTNLIENERHKINVKDIIKEVTDLNDNDIVEYDIKIAYTPYVLPKTERDLIDIFMDELYSAQ